MINDSAQPGVADVRLAPAGVEWDAIRVGQFHGLQAIERIARPGAVAVHPASPRPFLYFLVPVGSAESWDVRQTIALGAAAHVALPLDTKRRPPGPYWLNPPSSGLTAAAALRLALEQANLVSNQPLSAHHGPPRQGQQHEHCEPTDCHTLARAAEVLAAHRADADGWCSACVRSGIMTFHPCPAALWAEEVLKEGRRRDQHATGPNVSRWGGRPAGQPSRRQVSDALYPRPTIASGDASGLKPALSESNEEYGEQRWA